MKPDDIEAVLRQLENGEISEDETSENEDDIDYYSSQRELQIELEDEDDTANSSADPDLDADPPSVYESSDIQHLETVEQSSVPLVNNYTCNPRNMVWRVKNMDIVQNAFQFQGNTEYSLEILDLETPFQLLVSFL